MTEFSCFNEHGRRNCRHDGRQINKQGPPSRAPNKLHVQISVRGSGGVRTGWHHLRETIAQGIEAFRGFGTDKVHRTLHASNTDIGLVTQIVDIHVVRVSQ